MSGREYDLLIVGATGLTGKLVVEQIAQRDDLLRDSSGRRRWAVSGRNRERTAAAVASLCEGPLDIIEADLTDAASLAALTGLTGTVLNLAGPYTSTAENVIAACIDTQTSYIDLSGEIPLLKNVIGNFHESAVDKGIRIVQMAGWEAMPADLTSLLASRRATTDFTTDRDKISEGPGACAPVDSLVVSASFSRKPDGGLPFSEAVSAGTLSSIVEMLESPDADLIGVTGALLPPEAGRSQTAGLRLRPFVSRGQVLAPFAPVAFLNAPIVHRSAALLAVEREEIYRPAKYLEGDALGESTGLQAISRFGEAWLRTGLQQAIISVAHAPTSIRTTIAKRLRQRVPESGTGPTGRFQTDWAWSVRALATTEDGRTGEARLDGQGHPGYLATAAMIAEVGLRIAVGRAPDRFGCITPALALGSLDLDPWFVGSLRLY